VPTLAPGLADAPTAGMTSAEILAAAGGDIAALLLVQADAPAAALDAAPFTIAFADFHTEALDEHATVVFPAEIYAEKEGTVTHPDGRLQRVRQTLGRAHEVRPVWQVLESLLDLLGKPTGALTAPMVTAQVTAAVPFYDGIALDEIGGTGVRWQERDAASRLPAAELSDAPLARPPARPTGELQLGTAPALWSGPAVKHSPSLRFLYRGEHVELSVADAQRLGVRSGEEVELTVDGQTAIAAAQVRTGVPAGSAFLSPAALPEGAVEITRVREAVA
jgi:NADH-quinone oxidoreductase subunit G